MDSNNKQSPTTSDTAAHRERNGRPLSAEYEEAIKQRIVKRTGGRIRRLRVEVIGERVVIGGCAPSYHLKQLALRGACDALGSAEIPIELNVEVSGNS